MGEFAVFIEHSEAKSVSASEGFTPWPPHQGLRFWTPLGTPPPDPRYTFVLRTLTMAPPLTNPKYATDCYYYYKPMESCKIFDFEKNMVMELDGGNGQGLKVEQKNGPSQKLTSPRNRL